MKKLSEELQELADHAANSEKKVAAAENATKEKVRADLQKSQAQAKARQDAFKAKVKDRQAATAMQWQELHHDYHQKVQQIKNKIETEKEAHEVKKARQRADDSEWYAEAAISFAMEAIDEAEVAVLEAIDAEVYAETVSA